LRHFQILFADFAGTAVAVASEGQPSWQFRLAATHAYKKLKCPVARGKRFVIANRKCI
jgi:hypothetical protein